MIVSKALKNEHVLFGCLSTPGGSGNPAGSACAGAGAPLSGRAQGSRPHDPERGPADLDLVSPGGTEQFRDREHHQFESIHPFYDGNGRTGRIINILFLVKEGLLDTPILYLSRYISQTKAGYYRALQGVRDENDWEQWLLYLLRGVAVTARHTTRLVEDIRDLLQSHKHRIRSEYKFYSQDLINNVFRHPYTKVAFLEQDLDVSRATATRYLDALTGGGILEKHKLGRENYYVNRPLDRCCSSSAV